MGVAVAETEILRDITDRYGELTIQASGSDLTALDYYHRLHLDDDHEAAHIEGLARFIRTSDLYGIDLREALEGSVSDFVYAPARVGAVDELMLRVASLFC